MGRDLSGRPIYENRPVEIDEATLKQIATIGGGEYYRATDSKSLDQIFSQIDKLEKSTVEFNRYTQYRDLFGWFAGAGLAVLTLHMALSQTVLRRVP